VKRLVFREQVLSLLSYCGEAIMHGGNISQRLSIAFPLVTTQLVVLGVR
jgi:hypothetical protein